MTPMIVASTEVRPSGDQYTSSRYRDSANSSRISAAPIPKKIAIRSRPTPFGHSATATRAVAIMIRMPTTMWWR